jgi:uroporphyrinogen decarboxylase
VLDAIRAAKADFTFLHIHGLDVYFDLLARWPVQVLNWHDRRTPPSLKDARAKHSGALAGGINEWDTLSAKSPQEVETEVRDAIAQTGGRGHILAAGCVIPVDTPEANLGAVRQALGAA